MFNKYGLLLVAAISVSSQIVVAGGDGSEFDSLAAELAKSSIVAETSNGETASNTTGNAKTVNDSVTTSDAFKQETETAVSQAQPPSRAAGFEAIEDVQLVIDTSNIQDGDGIGSTQIQWQISENGDNWQIIPGAITPTFTPRDAHVNKYLRVEVSYVDGQGNSESIM